MYCTLVEPRDPAAGLAWLQVAGSFGQWDAGLNQVREGCDAIASDEQRAEADQNARAWVAFYKKGEQAAAEEPKMIAAGGGAQDGVPIARGMAYVDARKKLLEAGWRPVRSNEDLFGVARIHRDEDGFIEVEDCAGSGTAPCTFKFDKADRSALTVFTNYEVPKVSGWEVVAGEPAATVSAAPTKPTEVISTASERDVQSAPGPMGESSTVTTTAKTGGGSSKGLSDTATVALAIYAAISGLMVIGYVRPPFMAWYQSQGWIFIGNGPVDILFKQIGARIGFEVFIFGVSCVVGALGGWAYALYRFMQRAETRS